MIFSFFSYIFISIKLPYYHYWLLPRTKWTKNYIFYYTTKETTGGMHFAMLAWQKPCQKCTRHFYLLNLTGYATLVQLVTLFPHSHVTLELKKNDENLLGWHDAPLLFPWNKLNVKKKKVFFTCLLLLLLFL